MEYWEFNFYLLGCKERYFVNDMNMMRLAYNTGMLSRESKRKPKSLESYLNEIDRQYHGNQYRDAPVDKEKSRKIYEEIQRLKGDGGNGE